MPQTPKPRLEGEEFTYPSGGLHRRARARCQDGKLRVVKAGIPDTYFSIPARARIKGKTVRGVLLTSDEGVLEFFEEGKEALEC